MLPSDCLRNAQITPTALAITHKDDIGNWYSIEFPPVLSDQLKPFLDYPYVIIQGMGLLNVDLS